MNDSPLQATYILSDNSIITNGPAVAGITQVSATLPNGSHPNVPINVPATSDENMLSEPSITIEALPNDNLLSPDISIDEVCHTPSISADPSWPQDEALYMLEASEECEGLSDCDSTYFPSTSSSKFLSINDNIRHNVSAEATFKADGQESKEIVFVPRNCNSANTLSQPSEVRLVHTGHNNSKSLSSKNLLIKGRNITSKQAVMLLKNRHQSSSIGREKISFGKRKDVSLPGSSNCALPAPPGTTYKIARNATIIDLKKINRGRDTSKPIQLDQVAVTIDDKDKVKVVDFGDNREEIYSSDFFASPVGMSRGSSTTISQLNVKKIKLSKKKALKEPSDLEPESSAVEDAPEESEVLTETENSNEASFRQFEDESLLVAIENMRQLRVDCNVALVDPGRDYIVYAHRLVLVARSPYFYKNLYLRRKRLNYLHQFARFTLPHRLQYEAVEAVVSYMYMALQCFFLVQVQPPEPRITSEIKSEPSDVDSKPASLLHSVSAREDSTEDRRRRRKVEAQRSAATGVSSVPVGFMINAAGEEVRMKPPVAKLVESTLTPFLCKLEELFDPSSSTMQVARTSQHVITLWNAELLLTKLFDQNELTKYFTDFMNDVMEGAAYRRENVSSSYGNYVVETLSSVAGLDETYTRVGGSDSVVPEVEMLT
ncbi:BTB/POZ domain, partial [Trinorchestia longiramus]